MILIRHTIGSRLFYQTDHFEIQKNGNKWLISVSIPKDQIEQILKFKDELNFFVVGDHQKTWYYSSGVELEYLENVNQLIVIADHQMVYPV